MMTDELQALSPTIQRVVDWFGFWPSFHDAEVVSVVLDRAGISRIVVHAFAGTSEVDEQGYYKTEKHALVSLLLHEVSNSELLGFNAQNVLSDLSIQRVDAGVKVVLGGCFGLEGYVVARAVNFEVEAGIPENSIYQKHSSAGVKPLRTV